MSARKRSLEFKKLDAAHALAAKESLALAMPHLTEASRNLEFGVPCENCIGLPMIIMCVDCATNLLKDAIEELKEWPSPPQKEGGGVREA